MANVLAEDLRETVFKYVLEGHLTGDYEEDDLTPIDEELFKDFLIPKNWGLSTVKESCYIHARIGWQALSKREHLKNGDYMLITGTDFQNGLINYSTCVYVSKERYDMDEKIKIQNDDILITKDGTLGKVAVVKNLPKPATLNGGVFVVRPDERFNKEYVEIIFNSSYFARFINDIKKSTTIKHLNQSKLHSFLIPVPPIEEQQRIVNRVNELMAKIDEYEKLENQLVQLKEQFPKDMRDSLLQAAMHGQLSEQYGLDTSVDTSLINHKFNKNMDDTEFDVPDTWSVSTLEGVAIPVASKKYQIKESEVQKEGTCRVISQSQQMILGYTNKKEKLFHHNRPVITFGDHTTVVKFINFDFVVGADGLKIFEPTNIVDSKYMYYALTYLSTNLEKVGGYSRHYKFIKNKPIGIPPLEEQQRIVDKLDEMLPLVDSLAQMD